MEETKSRSMYCVGFGNITRECTNRKSQHMLENLCPERDFKLEHGGFCDEQVECLRHIFGKRLLVTSGCNSSKLQIWDIGGDDTDFIKQTGVININHTPAKGRKIASGLTENPSVLHGSQINDIQLTELASGKVLFAVESDSLDTVSGLQFVNSSSFVICANNGSLFVGDTRDPKMEHYTLPECMSGSHWTFGLRTDLPHSDLTSCSVSRLSSCGLVLVSDLRKMSSPVKQVRLNLQDSVPTSDFLTVTWAPALDSCLAVSGFNGNVLVFDTRSWTTDLKTPEPVFVHRGHNLSCEQRTAGEQLVVTAHVWHPWRPRTLLSAASDGSLHVWDWVDKDH
ncbi:WD repeat-containing protein 73 isoform X2 [Hoplias malabaricus]|uniref:WD repeat-containing protein 73 isoform X2 n=1 Tax=Hoplias malabaricus TaxID=27720 RepID=UPI00346314BC